MQAICQKLDIMIASSENCFKSVPLHNICPITGSFSRLLKLSANFVELRIFLEDEELGHDLLRTCFVPACSIACHRQLWCLASCIHFLVICGQLKCAWFIPGTLLWKFLQHRCVAYFMTYKPDCDYSSSTCEKERHCCSTISNHQYGVNTRTIIQHS